MGWPRRIAYAAVCLWGVGSLLGGAYLAAPHIAVLPKPEPDEATAALRELAMGDQGLALHVLSAECDCSKAVLGGLERRGPHAGFNEYIALVDGGATLVAGARAAGFTVFALTACPCS